MSLLILFIGCNSKAIKISNLEILTNGNVGYVKLDNGGVVLKGGEKFGILSSDGILKDTTDKVIAHINGDGTVYASNREIAESLKMVASTVSLELHSAGSRMEDFSLGQTII